MNEALLAELFSSEGIGTMVHTNEYQHIRRAMKKDVRRIMSLIRQSVQSEELIHRTRQDILSRLEDYWVLEIDKSLVGCIALHPYPDSGKAELACLYVSKTNENGGYGRKLMTFIEELARREGFKEMFALSTQAFVYLQQKGGFRRPRPTRFHPHAGKIRPERTAFQGADQAAGGERCFEGHVHSLKTSPHSRS